MRIVSLLPAATEIVYALGVEDELVGVTDECDWPAAARTKPRVSRSLLPAGATPAEIDALVTAGPATSALDEAVLAELTPDVILTQDLCAVCAVPAGDVDAALDAIGCRADVVSLDPSSLDEVLDGIARVGAVVGRAAVAADVVAGLRARLDRVAALVAGRPRRRVFVLEWGDPPFNGGHWLPEMVDRAGGTPVLAEPGRDSVRVSWDDIAAAAPDVVVFAPCGYGLDGAVGQGRLLLDQAALAGAEVWAVDADGCFVRPGPRLVDGVEILAAVLHPEVAGPVPAGGAAWLRD
jgi:iron complex transport system substrate-binding protein